MGRIVHVCATIRTSPRALVLHMTVQWHRFGPDWALTATTRRWVVGGALVRFVDQIREFVGGVSGCVVDARRVLESFGAERDDGIDAGGAPCWEHACHDRRKEERQHRGHVHERIVRRRLVQQIAQPP